jgi:2-oxoglutarate ferredoxin oxidoreductase subunit beta
MPLKISEMLAGLDGAAYVVRRSLHNVREIIKAKKAIKIAFQTQLDGRGFSMVELLSTCPTNWHMSATDSMTWLEEHMLPYYELGDFKCVEGLNVR